jgi:hypothetical protein
MTAAAQSVPARHLEVISGALALVAGLMAIGVQLFAPLVTVHVTGVEGTFLQIECGARALPAGSPRGSWAAG